jgi:hypothetical protein
MLTIRRAQMHVFEQARWREFVERVTSYVRENLTSHDTPDASVRESVEDALLQGRRYGFQSEYDLLRYVWLFFSLGSGFDQDGRYPWAREFLESPLYSPCTRMDLLTQMASTELGIQPNADAPVEYDDPDEAAAALDETADEEVLALDDAVLDFEPASEEPGELPEDVIEMTSESGDSASVEIEGAE